MPDTMRSIGDLLPLTQVVKAIQDPWLGAGSAASELVILSVVLVAAAALSVWLISKPELGFSFGRRATA
jgi:hypothetical protein